MKLERSLRNLSRNLSTTIAVLEASAAPPPPEETIANNFPQAWQKLQKQLLILKWAQVAMFLFIVLAFAPRLFTIAIGISDNDLPSADLKAAFFALSLLALAVTYAATYFRCPRCQQAFLVPGARAGLSILANPKSRCKNCGLLRGQKPEELNTSIPTSA